MRFCLKLKNMILKKISFFIFFCFLFPNNFLFQSNVFFGYDSNPLRLSENEINQVDIHPEILGNACYVHSEFIGFNTKFSYKLYKKNIRKTIFSLNLKNVFYNSNTDKSYSNFSIKMNHSLGKYQYLVLDYFLMPNFYLREYEDVDQINCEEESIYCFSSAFFSIERLRLSYKMPINKKKSSIRFGVFNEKELYDKNFTEYNLNKIGALVEYQMKSKKINYTYLFEFLDADNFTYLDGSFSSQNQDRSYKQSRFKFSIKTQLANKNTMGFIADMYFRDNLSTIYTDNLHRDREHRDITLTYWYKMNKNKFSVALRSRNTKSPNSWVEDLKTFNRFIITYHRYFNIVRF